MGLNIQRWWNNWGNDFDFLKQKSFQDEKLDTWMTIEEIEKNNSKIEDISEEKPSFMKKDNIFLNKIKNNPALKEEMKKVEEIKESINENNEIEEVPAFIKRKEQNNWEVKKNPYDNNTLWIKNETSTFTPKENNTFKKIKNNNNNEDNGTLVILIIFIVWFILFKDIWQILLNIKSSLDLAFDWILQYQDVVYLSKLAFWMILAIIFFISNIVFSGISSPMDVFARIFLRSFNRLKQAGEQQDPIEERKLSIILMLISWMSLLLTVIIIHYIYINTILMESKWIIETIWSLWLIIVFIFYTWYIAKQIQEKYEDKNNTNILWSIIIYSFIYIIGTVIALQAWNYISEELTTIIENKTNEYNIFN